MQEIGVVREFLQNESGVDSGSLGLHLLRQESQIAPYGSVEWWSPVQIHFKVLQT